MEFCTCSVLLATFILLGFVIPEISLMYVRQCKCLPWISPFQWAVDYFNRTLILTENSFRKEFIPRLFREGFADFATVRHILTKTKGIQTNA